MAEFVLMDEDSAIDFVIEDVNQRYLDTLQLLLFENVDGGHHKQWLIDQAVRKLTGPLYQDVIKFYEKDGNYSWDEGIAP